MKYRRLINCCLYTLPALLLLLCCAAPALATDVPLAWDASTSPNIAGYKVYYGNGSHTYGTPITIGNLTTYTVTGLSNGTYYFSVTAFDTDGNESDFSNEVSQVIGSSSNRCDINSDSSVNVIDLQLLINAILAMSSGSSYDANGDGSVNAIDLQYLYNAILTGGSCQ